MTIRKASLVTIGGCQGNGPLCGKLGNKRKEWSMNSVSWAQAVLQHNPGVGEGKFLITEVLYQLNEEGMSATAGHMYDKETTRHSLLPIGGT